MEAGTVTVAVDEKQPEGATKESAAKDGAHDAAKAKDGKPAPELGGHVPLHGPHATPPCAGCRVAAGRTWSLMPSSTSARASSAAAGESPVTTT